MKKTFTLLVLITSITLSQTVYDIQPGTKGNRIIFTLANISELNSAENVEVKLIKSSSSISFNKELESIELINTNKESDVSFTFDINRNAPVNKKDTVEFMITDRNGLMMMKSFIFNYTPPKEFKLEQNYPNPFNPTTTIRYELPLLGGDKRGGLVVLKVYDILGSEVKTLVNEQQEPGYYEVQFNGSNIASGMYVYRLSAGNFTSIKKMLIIK